MRGKPIGFPLMEEPLGVDSSDAPVAQRIERQPPELDAVGSNPAGRAFFE